MSSDETDATESPDDVDDDMGEPDLLSDDLEPVAEDLEAEELGVADIEDDTGDLDGLDTDELETDETASSDDEASSREVPSGVRPTDDEDDDDDDEELEADLGEILKERLASEDEDEDDEDDELGVVTGSRSASKQEDEILCEGCFLLVKPSQLDMRGPEPACPHCGTPIVI